MRHLVVLGALVLLGGCSATMGGGKSKIVELTTAPAGVTATVEGFGECETPCRIEVDKPRKVKLAKAGFKAQDIELTPKKKKVTIVMELAAPTTGVDTTALPEIK